MTDDIKNTKAIALLLKETLEGELRWRSGNPDADLIHGSNILVKVTFTAEKNQRLLRIYPFRFRAYTDEDEWHWEDDVALEVSDPQKTSWWQFPKNVVIWDLLEAVKFKTVDVDTFIDNLISEEE